MCAIAKTLPRFGYRMIAQLSTNDTPRAKRTLLEYVHERIGLRFGIVAALILVDQLVSPVNRLEHSTRDESAVMRPMDMMCTQRLGKSAGEAEASYDIFPQPKPHT